jgi:hypothetical protein
MTYEKAVNILVDAGFLAKADAPAAIKALAGQGWLSRRGQ